MWKQMLKLWFQSSQSCQKFYHHNCGGFFFFYIFGTLSYFRNTTIAPSIVEQITLPDQLSLPKLCLCSCSNLKFWMTTIATIVEQITLPEQLSLPKLCLCSCLNLQFWIRHLSLYSRTDYPSRAIQLAQTIFRITFGKRQLPQ